MWSFKKVGKIESLLSHSEEEIEKTDSCQMKPRQRHCAIASPDRFLLPYRLLSSHHLLFVLRLEIFETPEFTWHPLNECYHAFLLLFPRHSLFVLLFRSLAFYSFSCFLAALIIYLRFCKLCFFTSWDLLSIIIFPSTDLFFSHSTLSAWFFRHLSSLSKLCFHVFLFWKFCPIFVRQYSFTVIIGEARRRSHESIFLQDFGVLPLSCRTKGNER